jgi:hypothetical protein
MQIRPRATLIGLLALVIVGLALLAAGLPTLEFAPGRPLLFELLFGAPRAGRPATPGSGGPTILLILLLGSLIIVVAGALLSSSFRRWLLRVVPVYAVLIIGLMLALSALRPMIQGGGAPQEQSAPAAAQEAPAGSSLGEPPDLVRRPPEWLAPLLTLAIGAAVAAAIWRVRRRTAEPSPVDLSAQLAAGAAGALADLAAGGDLRDAVSRCYREMEQVLRAERGIARDRAMTPREFEERLAGAGLDDRHIRRLTRLFERVRYSPRGPDERDEREAVACLQAIAETYGGRA